jgi:hypothetical protein
MRDMEALRAPTAVEALALIVLVYVKRGELVEVGLVLPNVAIEDGFV